MPDSDLTAPLLAAELLGLPTVARIPRPGLAPGQPRRRRFIPVNWPRTQLMLVLLTAVALAFPLFAAHCDSDAIVNAAWTGFEAVRAAFESDQPVAVSAILALRDAAPAAPAQPEITGSRGSFNRWQRWSQDHDRFRRDHWPVPQMVTALQSLATAQLVLTGPDVPSPYVLELTSESTIREAAAVYASPRAGSHQRTIGQFRSALWVRVEQRLAFRDGDRALIGPPGGLAPSPLDDIRVTEPCSRRWEDLEIREPNRRAYCAGCCKDVFNFTAMSRGEIEQVLADPAGGGTCAMIWQRPDGHHMIEPCDADHDTLMLGRVDVADRFAPIGSAIPPRPDRSPVTGANSGGPAADGVRAPRNSPGVRPGMATGSFWDESDKCWKNVRWNEVGRQWQISWSTTRFDTD